MPEFAYKARNAQGGLVEGVLNCPDRGVAIRQIEQQNCTDRAGAGAAAELRPENL